MACCSSWKTFSCRSRSWVTSAMVHRAACVPLRGRARTRTRYQPNSWRAVEGRREADFLRAGAVLAGGLGEAVDRLRDFRRPGEQPLDRADVAAARAGKVEIGLVGIDDAAVVLDDDEAVPGGVGHELGDIVAGRLAAELHDADRDGEQEEHARHGEEGQQSENERLRLVASEIAQAQDRPHEDRRRASSTRPIWPGRSERSIVSPVGVSPS